MARHVRGMQLARLFALLAILQVDAARFSDCFRGKPRKRVLMLISDTGGGHRASALALSQAISELRDDVDVDVVDIWTDYAPWTAAPFGKIARDYNRITPKAASNRCAVRD